VGHNLKPLRRVASQGFNFPNVGVNQTNGEIYLSDQRSRAVLWPVLTKIDEDEAAQARARGCACGGALHRANYPRKVRGIAEEAKRESFCCAREGCRKRTTPASVRFLGRRVYAGFIVVLLTALQHGITAGRLRVLQEHLGVDRRTLGRWRQWWTEPFVRSAPWRTARGRLVPPPDESAMPGSLWGRFCATSPSPLLDLLRFLRPWSTCPAPG
jgi:hypothetical protein